MEARNIVTIPCELSGNSIRVSFISAVGFHLQLHNDLDCIDYFIKANESTRSCIVCLGEILKHLSVIEDRLKIQVQVDPDEINIPMEYSDAISFYAIGETGMLTLRTDLSRGQPICLRLRVKGVSCQVEFSFEQAASIATQIERFNSDLPDDLDDCRSDWEQKGNGFVFETYFPEWEIRALEIAFTSGAKEIVFSLHFENEKLTFAFSLTASMLEQLRTLAALLLTASRSENPISYADNITNPMAIFTFEYFAIAVDAYRLPKNRFRISLSPFVHGFKELGVKVSPQAIQSTASLLYDECVRLKASESAEI